MKWSTVFSSLLLMIPFSAQTVTAQISWTPADISLVEDSLSIIEGDWSMYIMGELRNNSEVPATIWDVDVLGFDAAGEVVFVNSATPNCSSWCGRYYREACVAPGDVAFFSVSFLLEQTEIDRYSVFVRGGESTATVQAVPVEISSPLVPEGGSYGTTLKGILLNTGDEHIVGLTATAVFRGSSGELVDVLTSPLSGERIGGYMGGLRAGASSEFSVFTFLSPEEFESYEIWINGTPYRGGNFRYAVAGIAHQPGYGGSDWRSSLSVTNRSGAEGHLRLRFFSDQDVVEREIIVADSESKHWDDVILSLFDISSQTAGFVRIDADVPLTVSARTAHEAEGGSYGQLMPTVTPSTTWDTMDGGILTPLRSGEAFRTNIGFVNFSDHSCAVQVRLTDLNGDLVSDLGTIEIPADSWKQINDVVPASLTVGSAIVGEPDQCSLWTYASVIDRASHDPTTIAIDPKMSIYIGPLRPEGLVGSNAFWSE